MKPNTRKPQQILFCKNVYSPGVKVENWTYHIIAEKKDNYVYRDDLSNLVSTYIRFGTADQPMETETQNMQKQIFTKKDPVYDFRPLVNFTSYPCTDTPDRNRLMKLVKLPQLPPSFGEMDYISTHQNDYRNPYPCVTKPLTMVSAPWLLNRLIRSNLTQHNETAPPRGHYQYLDTHIPLGHIRRMRLPRKQSFNPSTSLRDFPPVDLSQMK